MFNIICDVIYHLFHNFSVDKHMVTLIGYNTNLRGYLIVVKNKHCNIKTHILNIWTLLVVQIDPLFSFIYH